MLDFQKFGAFIITYERPLILKETISKLLAQTVPPEFILIVDNSASTETEELVLALNNPALEYYRVGYNSGPAGGSKIGLKILTDKGYHWIYWGDDDDPPQFDDSFERLFEVARQHSNLKIGVLGGVGQRFNRLTGNMIRVKDNDIQGDFIEVDVVAGGQTMIVNSDTIKSGILPEANLFFSFEDLDFCLKVKSAEFKIIVPSKLFLRTREKHGRLNFKQPFYIKKDGRNWQRQYFSVRNILLILNGNKLYFAYVFQFAKTLVKMVYGFRFGLSYGVSNFQSLSLALKDALLKRIAKNGS